jgi:hypothetical protein
MLHDEAHMHSATATVQAIRQLKIELLPSHPPYPHPPHTRTHARTAHPYCQT